MRSAAVAKLSSYFADTTLAAGSEGLPPVQITGSLPLQTGARYPLSSLRIRLDERLKLSGGDDPNARCTRVIGYVALKTQESVEVVRRRGKLDVARVPVIGTGQSFYIQS